MIVGLIIHVGGFSLSVFGIFGGKEAKTMNFTEEYDNVKDIELEAALMNVKIVQGDKFTVSYNGDERFQPELDFDEDTGKLDIEQKSNSNKKFGIRKVNIKSELKITVPEGNDFDEIIINSKLGNVEFKDINCRKLNIEADLGNVDGKNVIAEDIEIEANMGNVEIRDLDFEDADMKASMGNITIESVDDPELYNIRAKSSAGNVEINKEHVKNTYESKKADAIGNLELECSMGNISVFSK